MATLSVLKSNDPGGADRIMLALQGMQERQLITLEDAAVVSWPEGAKKPQTRQLHDMAGAGALMLSTYPEANWLVSLMVAQEPTTTPEEVPAADTGDCPS